MRVDREGGVRGKLFSSDDVRLDLSLAGNVPVRDTDDGARSGMDDLDQRFGFNIPLRMVFSVGDPLIQDQGLTLSPYLNYRIWQEDEGGIDAL